MKFSDKIESEKAINEMNGKILNGKQIKTGTASYKKNDKKNNNNLLNMQNDPNFLAQQRQYLNQFYLANGYQNYINLNPLYYQMLLLNQETQKQQNLMNMNFAMQNQNQDMNNLFGNLGLLTNHGNLENNMNEN